MFMKKDSVVVLLSGGMDSVTALYDSVEKHSVGCCISFDYGSKHNEREIHYAKYHSKRLLIPHVTIPLAFIGQFFKSNLLKSGGEIPDGHYEDKSMQKTVVPFRNGIMLSIAAGFAESAGAGGIVIAAHAGDHAIYPDCREEFMFAMASAIATGTYAGIEVIRPFINIGKEGIAQRGAELGVDYSKTWSCYKGGELHCGTCGTCVERKEAFELAGIKDPTQYI